MTEESTKTPNTDEGIFGNSLQLLSSIMTHRQAKESMGRGLNITSNSSKIRRTLLSMIKFQTEAKNTSLSPIEGDSQITGSVVLTKLDGGGSYHSASVEDVEGKDIRATHEQPKSMFEIRSFLQTPRQSLTHQSNSSHFVEDSKPGRFQFMLSLLGRAESASIVPFFDDPRKIEDSERETSKDPVMKSDQIPSSKYQEMKFIETPVAKLPASNIRITLSPPKLSVLEVFSQSIIFIAIRLPKEDYLTRIFTSYERGFQYVLK